MNKATRSSAWALDGLFQTCDIAFTEKMNWEKNKRRQLS